MYLAAFATPFWDRSIELAARNLAANAISGWVVVLLEQRGDRLETDGPRDAGFAVIPFSESFDEPALASMLALDEANDLFLVAGWNVAVNLDVDELVSAIRERGADLVAHFVEPGRCLVDFVVLSRRGLEAVCGARAGGRLAPAEELLPAVIAAAGLTAAELSEFVPMRSFGLDVPVLASSERARGWGALTHPVIARNRFVPALLASQPAADFFREGSPLQRALAGLPLREIAGPLLARLVEEHDAPAIGRLRAMAAQAGLALPAEGDLALTRT